MRSIRRGMGKSAVQYPTKTPIRFPNSESTTVVFFQLSVVPRILACGVRLLSDWSYTVKDHGLRRGVQRFSQPLFVGAARLSCSFKDTCMRSIRFTPS